MRRFFRNRYLPYLILWLVLLYGLDFAARKYGLYYIFHYLDKGLHMIGGISLGLFAYIYMDSFMPTLSRWQKFSVVVGFSFFVGGLWEAGEYLRNNVFGTMAFNAWDTTTDLICDTLGGLFSFIYLTYF